MAKKRSLRRANGEGSVYRLGDGRWRAAFSQLTAAGPRRVYRTRRTQGAALRALEDLRKNAESSAALDPTRLTVSEYLEKWLTTHVQGLAENTRVSYRTAVDLHISPRIGHLPLRRLAPMHVAEWIKACEESEVGGRATQAAFSILRSAMSHAVSPLRLISVSPCESIKAPRHRREDIHPFEANEVSSLLDLSRGSRMHAIVAIGFCAGLRPGEVLGLSWANVDFTKESITVSQQVVEASGPAVLAEPKTEAGRRTIRLPQRAIIALKAHRGILMREGFAASPLVFPNKVGKIQSKTSLHHAWKSLLEKAGLQQRGFHHARHTFATLSLIEGVAVPSLAKILGHSSPAITMAVYAHYLPSTEAATAQAMDRLFG